MIQVSEKNSSSKTVLLAEDDPIDEEMTLSALKKEPIIGDIVVVHDGVEALDYLYYRASFATRSGGDPSVMLLDLKMPRVNGLEVLRKIKSDLQLKTIPIVMLTSSKEASDLAECYKLGVNAYVVKPVRFNDFTKAVKALGVFWGLTNEPPPDMVKE